MPRRCAGRRTCRRWRSARSWNRSRREDILAAGDADLIAIGRQLIAEPHWLYRAALALGQPDPAAVLSKYYGFYLARRANVLDLTKRP